MSNFAGSRNHNLVTLTFDLLASGSMRAEMLSWGMCVSGFVLIAQAVFTIERGHTVTRHCPAEI